MERLLTDLLCIFCKKSGKLEKSLHRPPKSDNTNGLAMRCPQCGFDNEATASQCARCRTALTPGTATQLTAAQEAVNRLRRYVPAVVADSALFDQDRLRGERREVCILFVDVVNFTELAVSLDAEAVFNLINGLLGRMVECVPPYEGIGEKIVGEWLMVG